MWKDALLVMLSCTLFVQMGLSDAVQRVLHLRSRILSCPKCLSYWLTLACLLLHGCRVVEAVAASFLFAYLSLWLALLMDELAFLYNKIYEFLNEAIGASEDAPSGDGSSEPSETDEDEVPDVQ